MQPETTHTGSTNLLGLILLVVLNIHAAIDWNGVPDYTIKALITALIWVLVKVITDFITGKIQGIKNGKNDKG
jgi:uncharacterized membrane protein YjfL (UPF0719 family)